MIFLQLSQQLRSLSKLLVSLTDEQYNKKVAHLGNSSIGGHTRHVIELLQCAITGYSTGEVDYINRQRNLLLENDKMFAQSVLLELDNNFRVPDKHLSLLVEKIDGEVESLPVTTTYFREIVYNTEHTIHHLALIKVAITEMKLDIVDNGFGMAYSTIKYQASLNKMKKLKGLTIILSMFISCITISAKAQDTAKIFFTTSVGLLNPVSSFSNAYKNSLALNSGIEYRFSKHYFAQFVLDFNAVKYSQQVKDASSAYLFQKTSSSVFLAGINVGRNFPLTPSGNLFVSPYMGAGYANIGEPRLVVDNVNGIINQQVTRMQGIFGRAGTRLAFNTKSKVLQTIYVDASYWSANIKVQQSRPKAFSFLIGTRFGF